MSIESGRELGPDIDLSVAELPPLVEMSAQTEVPREIVAGGLGSVSSAPKRRRAFVRGR